MQISQDNRNSNALANVTLSLIGQHQKFATVCAVIYHPKTDIISNVA